LKRELGPEGAIENLTVRPTDASAQAREGELVRYVDIDASGRSRSRVGDRGTPAGLVPVARLDAKAIDKIVLEAAKASGVYVEGLSLYGGNREWNVDMLDGGEPDRFVANLDGKGLRLPGEPNPEPIGAAPDSLLRAANLERVLDAARKATSADARVTSFDVRPGSVALEFDQDGRTLALAYGYDAQLMRRDLRPATGAPTESVALSDLDPQGPERMARSSRRAVGSKGLAEVQYVLLNVSSDTAPTLSLYRQSGSEPLYLVADLHGRHLTWPGRT
jgi:hypothetical protein